MDPGLAGALLPGAALGGVLALLGALSRLARGTALPHLGAGALAGVLALTAFRMATAPRGVLLLVTALAGGALALVAQALDRRVRRAAQHRLLADLAVLAALLATAALLRPVTAVPLPFGPLGGQAVGVAAVLAAVVGCGGALLLALPRVAGLAPGLRWAVAGALAGVTVPLAAGALSADALAFGGITGLPDTAGLALRAAAVGLATRRDMTDAVAAGLVLGIAETGLARLLPVGGAAFVPVVAALVVGLVVHARDGRARHGVGRSA
jgi:hypothetical protein